MTTRWNAQPIATDELVINWHITETCNYACCYCFANWGGVPASEVWRDRVATASLLRNLHDFSPERAIRSGEKCAGTHSA